MRPPQQQLPRLHRRSPNQLRPPCRICKPRAKAAAASVKPSGDLEITGVFFALFAIYFASEAWKVRKGTGIDHNHFVEFCVFAVVFGYFCISSFVRARRREKR
jgi:hypothetical protein